MVEVGYVEVGDLPLLHGAIDYRMVQQKLQSVGFIDNVFLLCVALQSKFHLILGRPPSNRVFPVNLHKEAKGLLHVERQHLFDLVQWEVRLGIIDFPMQQMAFKMMLHQCKITKFFEINFKIFHCILATPALIAKIRKDKQLEHCYWCGERADLNHILLECASSNMVYSVVEQITDVELDLQQQILGMSQMVNPLIWIANFSIYKAHLQACDHLFVPPLEQFKLEVKKYTSLFSTLQIS